MEDERERVGEQLNSKLLQISNYEREFHKIDINKGNRENCSTLEGVRLLKRCHTRGMIIVEKLEWVMPVNCFERSHLDGYIKCCTVREFGLM